MATNTSTYKLNRSSHYPLAQASHKLTQWMYRHDDAGQGPAAISGVLQIPRPQPSEQDRHPEWKFCNYFLAYNGQASLQGDRHWTDRNAVLELTHNYGTENDPNYSVVNGNTEPHRGFGHIAISVDNIEAACKRIEDAGYPFQKKLTEGRMRHIAFAKDPDGYWVEIIRRADEDHGYHY